MHRTRDRAQKTAAMTFASMTLETSCDAANDNQIEALDLRTSDKHVSNKDAIVAVLALLALIILLPFLLI